MKRSGQDRKFSRSIRERDGFTCQRCGTAYEENSKGLHCAHMFSRGKLTTRFDPENAAALCYGCHRYLDTHPNEKRDFFQSRLGEEAFAALEVRSNAPYRSKSQRGTPSAKTCTKCKETKPLADFYFVVRSSGPRRFASQCRVCTLADQKRQRSRPEAALARRVRKYGLTVEEYKEMLALNEGVCEICKEPPSGYGLAGTFHIDHDAKTGRVRGLLCHRCNTAIGLLREDPMRMKSAMEYLWDAELEAQGLL